MYYFLLIIAGLYEYTAFEKYYEIYRLILKLTLYAVLHFVNVFVVYIF